MVLEVGVGAEFEFGQAGDVVVGVCDDGREPALLPVAFVVVDEFVYVVEAPDEFAEDMVRLGADRGLDLEFGIGEIG